MLFPDEIEIVKTISHLMTKADKTGINFSRLWHGSEQTAFKTAKHVFTTGDIMSTMLENGYHG